MTIVFGSMETDVIEGMICIVEGQGREFTNKIVVVVVVVFADDVVNEVE